MNRLFSRMFLVASLLFSISFMGCDDDDDDEPDPPAVQPTAAFTFTADELTVTFTNTSTDATASSWDFGDGNTSNQASPTHTYDTTGSYTVVLTTANGNLTATESQSVAVELSPENVRLKSGFVVVGRTQENSWFAQYFAELPTGTVDISQGTAFQTFFPLSIIDGAIYLARTDGSPGFEKLGVNGNEEFVEDGIISTVSPNAFVIAARDAEFGVFHDRADPNTINTFNPTTMQVTGTIDMTVANAIADDPVRYQDFIFRGDNEIFAPMRLEAGGNVPNVGLARVDIGSGQATNVAEFEGAGDLVVLNSGRRFVDETGNLYFWHAGNISVPTISGAILKVPAGASDYDSTYNFKVPEVNNPALTGSGTFMGTFNYYQNNTGFALINEALAQELLDLIAERGGPQNFTEEDLNLATQILFTSPTGAIVQVDLMGQTVSRINGLPPLSAFDNAGVNFLEGNPYFAISNPSVNAFYEWDEATNSVTKVFDMTGAFISSVVD
ncbi:MAG: PKD domain-containing protein, partial [Bacteroidota bacterium]